MWKAQRHAYRNLPTPITSSFLLVLLLSKTRASSYYQILRGLCTVIVITRALKIWQVSWMKKYTLGANPYPPPSFTLPHRKKERKRTYSSSERVIHEAGICEFDLVYFDSLEWDTTSTFSFAA